MSFVKKLLPSLIVLLAILAFPLSSFAQEGTLDTSFGTGGYLSTSFSSNPENVYYAAVKVQNDGKIIAAGYTTDQSTGNSDLAIARYNPDGSLDSSFGTGGKVILNQGDGDYIADGLAIQTDGKIILAAGSYSQTSEFSYIYRLNPDGTVDTTFGTNGVVTFTDGVDFDSVALQSDGKIVATGSKAIPNPQYSGQYSLFVTRVNPDGSIDTTFGTNGQFMNDLGNFYSVGVAIKVQTDGKLVINVEGSNNYTRNLLVRLTGNGTFDTTFGSNGIVTIGTSNDTGYTGLPYSYGLEIQSDGKILAGGSDYTNISTGNAQLGIARYNSDGSVDTSFGQNGEATVDYSPRDDYGQEIALQQNGQILIVGWTYNPLPNSTYLDVELARFNSNGSIDTSFGNNGVSTLNIDALDYGNALTLQPNGQIVVVGVAANASNSIYTDFIARFNGTPVILNQAPVVGSISAVPNPVVVNASTTASVSFTDANASDTHTAVWDWGDGTTTQGSVTESNGSGTVSNSHIYTAAGVYPVSVTVTDNHGAVASNVSQYYISAYSPTSQGLFSAGEVYTSPVGALVANASVTGKVQFGLSYKYQGTVPTGNRQFSMDFTSANFHFNATSVTSLVISNGIGTLTGIGTINGSGSYNFLVTGSESAGTIRVKITDSSNTVIYDTQPGAADTATPTTSVTGQVLAH